MMSKIDLESVAWRLNWQPVELEHAKANVGNQYGEETVVRLTNGREIRTPAFPEDASYVRIVQEGHELAYWTADEWACDPKDVMGAILGCANSIGCPEFAR